MHCDILNFVGSVYEIRELYGQGKKRIFEIVFEEAECELAVSVQSFSLGDFL